MSRLAIAFVVALGIGGCSEAADNGENPVATHNVQRPAADSAVEIETSTAIEANDPAPAGESTPPAAAACVRIDAAEAGALSGLELMGRSGSARIYARPRELSCSEPGPAGHGECELVGSTAIRIEAPSGTYGFRSTGEVPAVLIYSPDGFECRQLAVPATRGRTR